MILLLLVMVSACMAASPPAKEEASDYKRDIETVNWVEKEKGPPKDWSGCKMANNYCQTKGFECESSPRPGGSFYCSTPRQCAVKCSYDFECKCAFHDPTTSTCYLRSERCDVGSLKKRDDCPDCIDLYRLDRGEKCPSTRPLFDLKITQMSKTFCLLQKKSCPLYNYYEKPINLKKIKVPSDSTYRTECLIRCAKVADCKMVDWNELDKECQLKTGVCTDKELVDDENSVNALRLEAGVLKCPPKRQYASCAGTDLTDTCKVAKHEYCKVKGDCNSPFHVIREIRGRCESVEKCQEECDKECSCKAVSFNKESRTCILSSIVCSVTEDNKDDNLSFYIKKGPGQTCEESQICCRNLDTEYCPRKGEAAGFDFRYYSGSSFKKITLEDCKAYCTEECGCKAFVYNGEGCWLKSNAFAIITGLNRYTAGAGNGDFIRESACGVKKSNIKDSKFFDNRRDEKFSFPKDRFASKFPGKDTCGFCKKMGKTDVPVDENSEDTYYVKSVKGIDCDWTIKGRCENYQFKYCRRAGDAPGHSIRTFSATADECREACDKECSCKAFTTYGRQGCVLKAIVASQLAEKQCICKSTSNYYVKIRSSEDCPVNFGEKVSGHLKEEECCQFDFD